MDIKEQQRREKAFFALAERFRAATDADEVDRLGDEIGRFVFGESILVNCHPSRSEGSM
jgi:hypothetical protein